MEFDSSAIETVLNTASPLRIRRKRPSLRLVISSATIDAQAFLDFFQEDSLAGSSTGASKDEATIISLEGRAFPVEIAYAQQPVEDYVKAAVDAVWQIHLTVSDFSLRLRLAAPLIPLSLNKGTERRHSRLSHWSRRD